MTFPEVQVPARFQLSPKVAVSVVFVVGMFMNILDITIVNVALPSIAADFNESPAAVAAVSVGYLVSLAVFIPASGWLGDRFGNKNGSCCSRSPSSPSPRCCAASPTRSPSSSRSASCRASAAA